MTEGKPAPQSTGRSAAFRLLELVWRNVCDATGHSWERINHSMRDALNLAIHAGMRFSRNDFAAFAELFRSGYWLGNDGGHMIGERVYRYALIVGNMSAAQSFEAWKNRPPFIVDRIYGADDSCQEGHHDVHKTGRLAVGFKFCWQGHVVTVTSFAADGHSLVACIYKDRPKDSKYGWPIGRATPARRFKIHIDALRAEMTRRRKAKKAAKTTNGEAQS